MKNGTYESQKKSDKKPDPAEVLKTVQAAQANYLASQSLPGNGRNPWPPDGSTNHLTWGSADDILHDMHGNVSESQSKRMFSAIRAFTDGEYSDIRAAQASGDTTSYYGRKGRQLELFIESGVKAGHEWDGGTTYRGVMASSKVFQMINSTPIGQQVDPNFGGTASWTTRRSKAESFAGGGYGGRSVVFVTNGSGHKNAVSAKNLSYYSSENEVLASKGNTYTKTGQFYQDGTLYVFVDVS